MAFNYEYYLTEKTNLIAKELGLNETVYISTEQTFAKMKDVQPNSIFAIIKYLSSNVVYQVKTQPIQIIILSEQNQVEDAQAIFSKFAKDYNLVDDTVDDTYIKQTYTSPAVMSNFNEVRYGKRSLAYMSGTLYIMEQVIDITDFTIDDIPLTAINFNMNYQMTGNTQPVGDSFIAKTEKNVSSLAIGFTLPFLSKFTKRTSVMQADGESGAYSFDGKTYNYKFEIEKKSYEKFVDVKGVDTEGEEDIIERNGILYSIDIATIEYKIETNLVYCFLNIMKGVESGNKEFTVKFNTGDVAFDIPMKLLNCNVETAPNSPSSLRISLQE